MANIAITNYCNLQCPYCFANHFIKDEDKENITIEQLNKILEFLARSEQCGRIGLIGGEPTLHPQFADILQIASDFSVAHNTNCTFFTNGILLGDYLREMNGRCGCLINVNHPEVIGDYKWAQLEKSLKRAKVLNKLERINIGINLYHDLQDYGFIFDVADLIHARHIRTSYVAPTCQYENVNKDDYYMQAKELFLRFVSDCKDRNLQVRLDCNHIPECYFTEAEKEFMKGLVFNEHPICSPVVDITPDFKATCCFGAYELINLKDFENLQAVENYFMHGKMRELRQLNNIGKCIECDKHKNEECQGGCLAFSNYK